MLLEESQWDVNKRKPREKLNFLTPNECFYEKIM